MARFLTDEDFNNRILRGLLRRRPDLDIVRAQDVGLSNQPDPVVLEWAAQHGRIVLTHDRDTMIAHAVTRITSGRPMPGVCAVEKTLAIGKAVDDLLTAIGANLPGEWENQIQYIPI